MLHAAGEWVKCKKALVRPTEEKKFLEVNDFLVDGSAPMTIVVQLDIEIEGTCILRVAWEQDYIGI